MKRTIKKQIWLNREEAGALKNKAKKACLTEAALIRLLLSGYEPKVFPGEEIREFTKALSQIGNNLNQLVVKAHSLGYIDAIKLEDELRRLHRFQADMEEAIMGHAGSLR